MIGEEANDRHRCLISSDCRRGLRLITKDSVLLMTNKTSTTGIYGNALRRGKEEEASTDS